MTEAMEKRETMAFPAMLEKFKSQIERALPKHLDMERMVRIALTEFRRTPALSRCTPASVFASIIVASQLGLEPGVMGDGSLVPFKSECQFIPGYQGLVKLIRNGGAVNDVTANVVYEKDHFAYRTGLVTVLEHTPELDGETGPIRLVYAVATMRGGGHHIEVMRRSDVLRIRDRSSAFRAARQYGRQSAWETDEAEMWRKTAVRRIAKMLPKSSELSLALALQDAAGRGLQNISVEQAIEGTWTPPPMEEMPTENPDAINALNARLATPQKELPSVSSPSDGATADASLFPAAPVHLDF